MTSTELLQTMQKYPKKTDNTANPVGQSPQSGVSTPSPVTSDTNPALPQGIEQGSQSAVDTPTPDSTGASPELLQVINQAKIPDADKLREAGEASVMGAGDLPNPYAPQDATDTQRLNQAVASAELTGATPEEIQKQILAEYPDWQPVQRKISQEEKDKGLWGTRWLTADTEYGIKLPDGTIWSINKPRLSWGDFRSATVQEIPYAIASVLTGGATLGARIIRNIFAMAGVNIGQQAYNVARGGREAINPVETALVAGASGMAEPVFGVTGWGLRKMGENLFSVVPGSAKIKAGTAKVTNKARKSFNNILANNGKGPQLSELTPQQLLELEDLEKQAYQGRERVLTPQQFEKELKQAVDTAAGFKQVDNISDIPLTSAEEVFDPVSGPTRQHQKETTKEAMDEEKRLAGVEDSLLEDTLDIRNERIAELLTQEGGLLSGKGKKESLEFLEAKLTDDINDIKGDFMEALIKALRLPPKDRQELFNMNTEDFFTSAKIRKLASDAGILDLFDRGKTLQNDLAFTQQQLKGDMSPMTVEETAETVADSLTQYNDAWNDHIKWLYDQAKARGQKINMSDFEKDLIPYGVQLSNTPTVRKVYEQFIKMLKSDDTFTMQPDGTQKSEIRPRTIDELELARRYLRDNISDLKKVGATFHEGEQLQKVYDKFLQNIKNLSEKPELRQKILQDKKLDQSFAELVDNYFDRAGAASDEFKRKQEMFNDKGFLTKVVDRIEKGETTPKQLLGMFLSAAGEPKMGQAVIDKIKNEPSLNGPVKDALLFSLLVEPSATGVTGKNLRLGQTLISRWNRIKNNTQVQELFGKNEWDELEKAMRVLTRVDVSRREGRINSATADRMLKGLRDTISNASIPGKILNKIFSNIESGFEDITNQKGIQTVLVEMADKHNRPIVVRGKASPLRTVASTGAVLETNEGAVSETNEEETK